MYNLFAAIHFNHYVALFEQVRDVQGELVRAVLHQLRQREAAAAVLQPRVQAGAGRVREGGD